MTKRNLIFLVLILLFLTACGPSPEELAFQTQEARTVTAASWTETATPTSTEPPTMTLTPTLAPTATFTATLTPTITPTSTLIPTPDPYLRVSCPFKFCTYLPCPLDECREWWIDATRRLLFHEHFFVSRLPAEEDSLYMICRYFPFSELVKLNGDEQPLITYAGLTHTFNEAYGALTYEELQAFLGINCSEILKQGPPSKFTLTPAPPPDFSIEVQCPYEEPYEDDNCKETMLNHFTTLIYYDRLFSRFWTLEQQPYLLCKYFPDSETLRTGEINQDLDPALQKPFTPMTYEQMQIYLELNCNEILREGKP